MANSTENQNESNNHDLYFRYYEDQWTHVRHHESLRSSLTFQILVAATAIVAAYISVWELEKNTIARQYLLYFLGAIMILLGGVGYCAVKRIEKAARKHILRARKARKEIVLLEKIIEEEEIDSIKEDIKLIEKEIKSIKAKHISKLRKKIVNKFYSLSKPRNPFRYRFWSSLCSGIREIFSNFPKYFSNGKINILINEVLYQIRRVRLQMRKVRLQMRKKRLQAKKILSLDYGVDSAKRESTFPKIEPIYLSFNQIVVVLGIILVLTAFNS
ncbi:hypothetical protein [Acaryochloris marina]|uniref:SMODS and SLOG-associating 2TM effector domain-containing protein n=1 Tax=Acaryochloris marina (strain MBIC 11017) TaxID=329726 RepID=A8ZPN4_ACAM1|nr:hypothetical protein [Acaryochloris marina]ABW32970.1 hypothetical protein AM1_E0201 [Acaryochloris marina MBIC11017]